MRDVKPTKTFVAVRDGMPAGALARAVVAMGNFDGVHRGHRAVIGAAMARARALGTPAAALTFEPHPRVFFRSDEPLFRLTPEPAKLRLLAGCGLDGAVVLSFDAALAQLTAEEFVSRVLLRRFAVSGVAIGADFRFGKERGGSADFLKAQGIVHDFAVDVVPPLRDGDRTISSGPIRAALTVGDVAAAAALLGYPWFVTGTVVHGDKRGRSLGYPTANMVLDADYALKHGIYAVRVGIGPQRHDGVASFGRRPMFDNGQPLLEVHLFDFAEDLNGKPLDIAFIAWIREEENFSSIGELTRRMDEDSRVARAALARAGGAFPPLGEVAG
jgi:riboflavin kinase/FMN adenylyltransferase